jgi:hypothetical protein
MQRNEIRRDVGTVIVTQCSATAMQLNAVQCNATRCNMQQEQDSTSNTSAYVSFSYDESAILGYKCMNFLLNCMLEVSVGC